MKQNLRIGFNDRVKILRAMKLPAGRHTVEWRFRAPGWAAAEAVTLVSSLLILLGAAAALIYCFRKKKA